VTGRDAPLPARALVFIGFMGSGKSTAAEDVGRALGVAAVDSDRIFEERAGGSIAEIFAREGEGVFRERETGLVLELLAEARPGSVLALGGGSVLSEQVREALRAHLVVLLEIDAESAWERVRGKGIERPLARERERFRALHEARAPLYEELADAILPAVVRGVALRALPSLTALSRAPAGTRMLWAYAASGEYPVLVGRGLLAVGRPQASAGTSSSAVETVWPLDRENSRLFCVSDETVADLYAGALGKLAATISVPPGEQSKTLASAELIWRELARGGMTRSDHLVALGGGVIGDLAGFCAATYQRGVPIVHVPTTVVAQVDSAYGGKTGVDLPEAKNYVGAYHQPAAVLVDPDTLQSLPEREASAGWVEVLKTALIAGGELWRAVAADETIGEQVIFACARTKLAIVAEDERDSGPRQVLNLGHTIGHAIEAATGYGRYRHGEAVALGLLGALGLSDQTELREQVCELLERHDLPVTLEGAAVADIMNAMQYDKKRLGAVLASGNGADGTRDGTRELSSVPPFVLLDAPGRVRFGCEVAERDVRRAIESLLAS
jgi:shikimate kinase/3-dehydroquinate synthase